MQSLKSAAPALTRVIKSLKIRIHKTGYELDETKHTVRKTKPY